MDEDQLAKWASRNRPEVIDAVAADIREHLAAIPSREDVYGYAILPGDPTTSADGMGSLVAAYNRRADISVGPDESEFTYYKYSVDEWQHWDHGKFPRSDSLLTSLNGQFAAAHQRDANVEIDELQEAYSKSLLDAILDGVAIVKSEGRFSQAVEFLAIWISDSDNPILEESVRRLNSPEVAEEFLGEFGSS
jgi:hypothetical protein